MGRACVEFLRPSTWLRFIPEVKPISHSVQELVDAGKPGPSCRRGRNEPRPCTSRVDRGRRVVAGDEARRILRCDSPWRREDRRQAQNGSQAPPTLALMQEHTQRGRAFDYVTMQGLAKMGQTRSVYPPLRLASSQSITGNAPGSRCRSPPLGGSVKGQRPANQLAKKGSASCTRNRGPWNNLQSA